MSQSDKEMIIGLLRQQLDKENRDTQQAVFDDPDCSLTGQENTARLVVAIELLTLYEWEDFEEEDGGPLLILYVRYRRPGWTDWVLYPCKDQEEVERIKSILRQQGYEVQE